jgi:cytochrome c biogenesis protein CcmG/thiol:disulfide interchange protein DsbE
MRRLVGVLTLSAIAAVIGLLAVAVRSKVDAAGFVHRVTAGQKPPAPALNLPGLYGGSVSLAAYHGRPVVVNFWASWCGPCADEAPLLADLSRTDHGVVFVGVDIADTIDAGRAFAARYGLTYPDARAGTDYASNWGVTGQPETFVLDRRGRAIGWYPGPVDPAWLRSTIQRAAA